MAEAKQRGFKVVVDGKEIGPGFRPEEFITDPVSWAAPPYKPIQWVEASEWTGVATKE